MPSSEAMVPLPARLLRSLTRDQGVEMSRHDEFTAAAGVSVFFCERARPWQRGTNENTACCASTSPRARICAFTPPQAGQRGGRTQQPTPQDPRLETPSQQLDRGHLGGTPRRPRFPPRAGPPPAAAGSRRTARRRLARAAARAASAADGDGLHDRAPQRIPALMCAHSGGRGCWSCGGADARYSRDHVAAHHLERRHPVRADDIPEYRLDAHASEPAELLDEVRRLSSRVRHHGLVITEVAPPLAWAG